MTSEFFGKSQASGKIMCEDQISEQKISRLSGKIPEQRPEQNILSRTPIVWMGALISCALWGGAFPAIKIGYGLYEIEASATGDQILFAGFRFILAGFFAIAIGSLLYRRLLFPGRGMWGKILKLCLLQTVGQYFFFYLGLAHSSGVSASIIQASSVFVALFVASALFHQERMTRRKLLGSALGFSGVLLLNLAGLLIALLGGGGAQAVVGSGSSLPGQLAVFASTVMYAFSSVFLKEYSREELPFTLSGYQFFLGGILLCLAGRLMGGSPTVLLGQMEGAGLGILLLLAGISAVAYSLWGQLLKYNPVSKVAVFGFMTPVFGVIFSTIFLQEKQGAGWPVILLSLILVCAGTILAQSKV